MQAKSRAAVFALLSGSWIAVAVSVQSSGHPQETPVAAPNTAVTVSRNASPPSPRAVLDTYCVTCHNQRLRTAGLALDSLDVTTPGANPEVWERVIAKLRAGSMPPPGLPRPDPATYQAVAAWLETEIDRAWAANPNPGRINAGSPSQSHRIQQRDSRPARARRRRAALLPGDETADGSFDNFADVADDFDGAPGALLSVARRSRGSRSGCRRQPADSPRMRIPLHVVQDDRQSEDLPFGSRGGIAIRYDFPVDGEYLIKVRLRRQYQDYIMGMGWPQQLDVRLDGKLLKRFTVGGGAQGRPAAASYAGDGEPGFAGDPRMGNLHADRRRRRRSRFARQCRRVRTASACRSCGSSGSPKVSRSRCSAAGSSRTIRSTWDYASVGSVQIGGPYTIDGSANGHAEPSRDLRVRTARRRRRTGVREHESCRDSRGWPIGGRSRVRTCRRCSSSSIAGAARAASFDAGIQFALERLLVDPDFLLRVYRDPTSASPRRAVSAAQPSIRILSDLELASRLSFFLWSSIPDERLLDLAERGQLTRPAVLEQQVRRMLADPRATRALVDDFAAQWLNLRRVERGRRRSRPVSQLRREPAPGVPARDRALRREHVREDRSVARPAERRLHVRQRAARAALRDPGCLRQPVPARHAAQPRSARRPARATERCWPRRPIRTAPRPCCAASGCWTTSSACPSRLRRRA